MIIDRLNVDEYINSKKEALIDAFVMFYGEEKREEIAARLNATIFLGYDKDSGYKQLVGEATKIVKDKAIDYFFEKINMHFNTPEERKAAFEKYFGYSSDLKKADLGEYYHGIETDKTRYEFKHAVDIMKQICDKPDLVALDENGNETQEFLDAKEYMEQYRTIYEEIIAMYDKDIAENVQKYMDIAEEMHQIRNQIQRELDVEYIKMFYPYLSEEDKKIVDTGKPYLPWYQMKSAKLFCDSNPTYRCMCKGDYFTEESDKKLADPKESEYTKNQIKKNRIEYFKKIGIDLGDNYDDYVVNEQVIQNWPNREIVEAIKKIKDELKLKEEIEVAKRIPHIKELMERTLNGINTAKSNEFLDIIINGLTCITTNYERVGDQLVEKPLLFFPGSTSVDAFDCRLVHECNHAYEMRMMNFDGDNIRTLVGWDFCDSSLSVEGEASLEKRDKRSFELFNEIINELIAQDITKLMHENGTYIIGDEKTSHNTSHSGYQMTAFLAKDFYETYKDEIIASRKGDMSPIFEKVGEENFMAMNQLIIDFTQYFQGFKIYRAYDALQKNEDTEEAIYYKECASKRDEILQRMLEHSNNLHM